MHRYMSRKVQTLLEEFFVCIKFLPYPQIKWECLDFTFSVWADSDSIFHSMVYISVIITHILHITNHAGPPIFIFKFEKFSYLFSLKNSRPCRDLNPGPPRYQADMLPIELSWLGSSLKSLLKQTKCLIKGAIISSRIPYLKKYIFELPG